MFVEYTSQSFEHSAKFRQVIIHTVVGMQRREIDLRSVGYPACPCLYMATCSCLCVAIDNIIDGKSAARDVQRRLCDKTFIERIVLH